MLDTNKLHIHYKKLKNKQKSKIEKYTYDDFDFYMWDYEEQTKVKHKVLEEYLFVWATKLGSVNNIIYYDGFSGCGAYYNSTENELNYGSPIIAKQQFAKARRNNKSQFYFNEKKNCNIENLKKVFIHSGITTDNVVYTNGEFETNIVSFLDVLERNPKPTFFMIDPYGINVNFKTIERIMNIPKTEVFFNFMYNFPRRFTKIANVESNLTNLFGTDKWKEYKEYSDEIKEKALKELYREQLKTCSKYVYQYRMSFPNIRKTLYYLFHATNNREGCSIMKDAFAKINFGNVEFLGPNQPRPEQLSFDMSDIKIDNLKNIIWNECKGKIMQYYEIIDKYIDSTPYLERHIRQAILSSENEYLKITRGNVQSKTVKPEDKIEFFNVHQPKPKKVISIQQTLF